MCMISNRVLFAAFLMCQIILVEFHLIMEILMKINTRITSSSNMRFVKAFGLLLVFGLVSCSSQKGIDVEAKKDVTFDYFNNQELNDIVNSHIEFVRQQVDSNIHRQSIHIYFKLKGGDTMMLINSAKYLSELKDTNYNWIKVADYGYNKILVADRLMNPLSLGWYEGAKFADFRDSSIYHCDHIYDERFYEDCFWLYHFDHGKFILKGKNKYSFKLSE